VSEEVVSSTGAPQRNCTLTVSLHSVHLAVSILGEEIEAVEVYRYLGVYLPEQTTLEMQH